jgi:hypothetical protein
MPSMKSILTTLVIALAAVAIAGQLAKRSSAAASVFGKGA